MSQDETKSPDFAVEELDDESLDNVAGGAVLGCSGCDGCSVCDGQDCCLE